MEEAGLFNGVQEGEHPPAGAVYRQPGRNHRRSGKGGTDARIRELLGDHPHGLTAEGVGRALSLSRSAAARHLNALARAGEIGVMTYGQTRVFTLPRRAGLASALRKPAPLLLVLSPALRVTGVNDPLLSVFRLGREELVGKNLARSPLARHLGGEILGLIRNGAGGLAHLPEFGCIIGDARYVFRAGATPLAGPRGPAGMVVSLEDVTLAALRRQELEGRLDQETLGIFSSNERLLAEFLEGRQEAEELRILRSSVDQAPVPAFWIGRDGRILRANHAAAALLGYGEEELAGMSWAALGPDQPPGSWDTLRASLDLRPAAGLRYRFRTREGLPVAVALRAGRITHGDRELVFILAMDLAEEERAEEALRQANGRLNLLAAITRHDALNDIAALGMYLALPEGGAGPGVQVKMAALVEALRLKVEFTRDYAGLGLASPVWEELAAPVQRGISTVDTGPLRIDLDLPAIEVYRDPLFERAVANLAENTLRHGGHATFLRVRARVEEDACTLSLEDDGVGIPDGKKEAIFRSGYGRNTGLGLFLVREVLALTGMTIRETGEPGKGARFEIRIPRGGFRRKEGSGSTPVQMPVENTARLPPRERAGDIA